MNEDQEDFALEPIHGVFTDLWTAVTVPPKWIVEDLLPPGLTVMGAPPKSGKSTITLAIAGLVSGLKCEALPDFLSKVPTVGVVMVFSYEASAGELRHTLEVGLKVKGNPDESMLVADDPWKYRLDDPNCTETMLAWLRERRPRLVILDPLRNFHELEEKDSGIIRLLLPLRQWAVENESSVLVVHHTKKPGEDARHSYSAHDLRGTSALFGIADAVLMLTPLGAGSSFGHLRIAATFKRARGWDREFTLSAWDNAGARPKEVLKDEDRIVLNLLKAGPLATTEIGNQTHLGKRASDHLRKLERNNFVQKRGHKWALREGAEIPPEKTWQPTTKT